ncbi:MAG TPA: beta-N-acetylhexosaminidase, partial [candidate division Zixibacteria bacterium]|nr:beta-N-acetylhexosaminidase [candidate division Zixibacteria bacterium]
MTFPIHVIPRPAEILPTGGGVRLRAPIPVHFAPNDARISRVIAVDSDAWPGGEALWRPVEADQMKADPPGIHLLMEQGPEPVAESYRLLVGERGVRVTAASPSGLFYGLQTLRQLLWPAETGEREIVLPGMEIRDAPRFGWRGMHLDVSRHFFPPAFIKRYIDLLAFHKLNIFHWHLTDDQGWRIEIGRYPRLTEIGAWRTEPDGRRYGGFYTQAEIREIVRYAAARQVTVVPEIELPGHATAALAAYPEYSCTGGPFQVSNQWGVFDDVYCAGNDAAFTFLEDVLSEVADLFPSPYLHIGGDECPKARWQSHDLCRRRKDALGLADEDALQAYFVGRVARFLRAQGKRVVGWDEILDGGAPEGAVIMAWQNVAKGSAAARAGHDVVMCPMSNCYFDHYQGTSSEPQAIGGFTPLEAVHAFEPTPPDLPPDLLRRVLG